MIDGIKELSTFDYLHAVRNRIVNAAAMGAAYPTWGDEFARKEVQEAWSDTAKFSGEWERRVTIDDLRSLPDVDLNMLGFSVWNENHRLIPLWAWNYIQDGSELKSISGDIKTKGIDDIDLDVRFGCIAWGFDATPE